MAAALSHPNLVAVYDVGEEGGLPYIVMEYVDGESLAELTAREGPLAPDRAVDLLLQVCAGLEHAHAAGLVHRDIKPQNLLVRRDGVVKIADFGIARTLDATQLTQAGTVLGTAAYLAPEQAAGERVTSAADLYSLGVVGYELLTGATPTGSTRSPTWSWNGVRRLLRSTTRRHTSTGPCAGASPSTRPIGPRPRASWHGSSRPVGPRPRRETSPPTAPSRKLHLSRRVLVALAVLAGIAVFATSFAIAASRGDESPPPPPAPPPAQPAAQPELVPRGDTPAESARLLAQWLRDRAG